jgi:hypothetical protein
MNRRQKIVVLVGVAVVALMLLFPPWRFNMSPLVLGEPRDGVYIGYHGLIFDPPSRMAVVDVRRLAVQCALVAVLALGACVVAGRMKGDGPDLRGVWRRANREQKTAVLIGTALLLGMLLYPPWGVGAPGFTVGAHYEPPVYVSHGYAPVFAPPHPAVTLNTFRLFIQCAVVVLVTFGLYVALARKSE